MKTHEHISFYLSNCVATFVIYVLVIKNKLSFDVILLNASCFNVCNARISVAKEMFRHPLTEHNGCQKNDVNGGKPSIYPQ